MYATSVPWTALAIDGVTVFDSAFSTTDTIMYTYLRGRYGTGNNYSFEFPYGQSITITGTNGLKIVSYKYQRIAETS